MTQVSESRFWSIFGRILPATLMAPSFDLSSRDAASSGEDDEADEKLRLCREENFYWGWCTNGHW